MTTKAQRALVKTQPGTRWTNGRSIITIQDQFRNKHKLWVRYSEFGAMPVAFLLEYWKPYKEEV